SRSEMIPTSVPLASQTGRAPILSELSRVQTDVIDSSGMDVASDCRFDLSSSDTLITSLPSYAGRNRAAGIGLNRGRRTLLDRASGSNQALGARQAMSQKGGKRAYEDHLGKDRSARRSRHS